MSPPRSTTRRTSRLSVAAVVCSLLMAGLAACGGGGSADNVLRWYIYAEPSGAFVDAAADCTEAAEGRYVIETVDLPANADEQREQLVRRLAAGDRDIDIIGMDVIWTAEFVEAGWIDPVAEDQSEAATEDRLDAAIESATYDDTLYAAPFNSNAVLLWYREGLTPDPPATWDEMIEDAAQLQAEGEPNLILGQGQRYEGLVVWFTSLLASAGGSVLNEDGTEAALEEGPTVRALEIMRDMANSPSAPPNFATAREDDARLEWEAGQSAFMTNYSFVWPSANGNAPELAEEMAWTRFPAVEPDMPSRVTIGGFNLGVGAFSDQPELAAEAVTCLVGEDNQIRNAIAGGLLPVTESLYEDPELTEATTEAEPDEEAEEEADEGDGEAVEILAFPYAETIRDALQDAVVRPQTPFYNDVALAIARTLHPTEGIDPERDAERLRDAIEAALQGEGLL
ncbi:ABC transporter substrate-binding protein [soil metagenome]